MITRQIHFGGQDVRMELNKNQSSLVLTINGQVRSMAPFPEIHIENERMSDFWDLLREEVVQISYGKAGQNKIKCLLLKKVQQSLEE